MIRITFIHHFTSSLQFAASTLPFVIAIRVYVRRDAAYIMNNFHNIHAFLCRLLQYILCTQIFRVLFYFTTLKRVKLHLFIIFRVERGNEW